MEDISAGRSNQESSPTTAKIHRPMEKESGTDRLSDFPDKVLVRILSLLKTEDAVRRGILSKRWRHLWTLVDSFVFHLDCYSRKIRGLGLGMNEMFQALMEVVAFVDNTLTQCASPNIKKFSFSGYFYYSFAVESVSRLLEKWIQYIYQKNMEQVDLNPRVLMNYKLPECFYQNSSVVGLNLRNCGIKIAALRWGVSWKSLKNLMLDHVFTNDGDLAAILSGCPVLDTMKLHDVSSFGCLNIDSPSLRKLIISNFQPNAQDDKLKIKAPWLKELVITGEFCGVDCMFVDMNSLVHLELTFTGPGYDDGALMLCDMVARLLGSVHYVEELIVGRMLVQALAVVKWASRPSPLLKCKILTVQTTILKYDLPAIACLVQGSADLETLVIEQADPWEVDFRTLLVPSFILLICDSAITLTHFITWWISSLNLKVEPHTPLHHFNPFMKFIWNYSMFLEFALHYTNICTCVVIHAHHLQTSCQLKGFKYISKNCSY